MTTIEEARHELNKKIQHAKLEYNKVAYGKNKDAVQKWYWAGIIGAYHTSLEIIENLK